MAKTVKLNNGNEMPTLGYGVFQVPAAETRRVVTTALDAGYRLIDTAASYMNERAVGQAINASSVSRDQIFLTTKLWAPDYGDTKSAKAIDDALERLGQDYIDLLLIHAPISDYYGAWRAMEAAVKAGKVRNIGVSNFAAFQVEDLIVHNEIKPVVDQIQINPLNPENKRVKWLEDHGVVPEAWGPLGQAQNGIFTNPVLTQIAQHHQATVGQVMLAWNIQRGVVVIPKSAHKKRIEENIGAQDITLTDDEMDSINSLDSGHSYFEGLLTPSTIKTLSDLKPDYYHE